MSKTLIWVALELGIPSWTHLGIFGFRGAVLKHSYLHLCTMITEKCDFGFRGRTQARVSAVEHRKGDKKKIKGSFSSILNSLFSLSRLSLFCIFIISYHGLSFTNLYQLYSQPIYWLIFFYEQVKGCFGSSRRRPKLPTLFLFILWYSKVII